MILLIMAAGKSTRFNGYPKAFCSLGKEINVNNTIEKSSKYVEKVYVGINKETFEYTNQFDVRGELISIVTGQGDADSIYKCVIEIKRRNPEYHRDLLICWGDAVFFEEVPFKYATNDDEMDENYFISAVCSWDKKPYAWFDYDNTGITKVHFYNDSSEVVEYGMHDQSLFRTNIDIIYEYLKIYREKNGLTDKNINIYNPNIKEIKLLEMMAFYHNLNEYKNAGILQIPSGSVMSFNSVEELENIKKCLREG